MGITRFARAPIYGLMECYTFAKAVAHALICLGDLSQMLEQPRHVFYENLGLSGRPRRKVREPRIREFCLKLIPS